MERAGGEAGDPTPPVPPPAAAGTGGAAKGRSCKGCLFYSSVLRSRARGPVCVGITRALPQGYPRAPLQPPSPPLFVSGLGFLLIHPAAVYNALKLFLGSVRCASASGRLGITPRLRTTLLSFRRGNGKEDRYISQQLLWSQNVLGKV
jgi:hypothetical protein